ncbi:hypothetical protein CUMW_175370, partial [Citrus unshiu]
MEVKTISRECIKPSSATPLHLKSYKLCLLDQYQNHQYLSLFFYYPLNLSGAAANIDLILFNRLQLLKQSLSETLVQYYPLAGKLTEIYSIDCNDEGIYFQEARAKSSLNEFLSKPDLCLINKFIPVDGNEQSGQITGAHAAKVQVVNIREKQYHILFMMLHLYFLLALGTRFCRTGRFVTKRFVFEAKAIAELKARAISSSVRNPTRVEVVSALLAKPIMAAVETKSGSHKPTFLTHAVNLRRKAKPPLSEHLVGNIIYHVNTLCTDDDVEIDDLVCQLREAITRLDGDFVKSLQGAGGFRNLCQEIKDEAEVYTEVKDRILFTGWCSFKGFYDINFGWGKPIWVSVAGFGGSTISIYPYIVLMNTRLGDGIEAWVNLLEDDVNLLQVDKQLLAFATLDPSPL